MPDLGSGSPDWRRLLDGVSHVVHLAGIAHATAPLAESVYMRVNAEGSAELARAAGRAGVSRFVLMSSVRAQSGAAATEVLTEATPAAPNDVYGRSKLAAEQAVAVELGARATSLRPVLVLGPSVKGNLGQLRQLARSHLPLPFGALANRRSILGLSNLAAATMFALTQDTARGKTYLVADPEPLGVRDLIAEMRAAIGRRPRLFSLPPELLRTALRLGDRGSLAASLLGTLQVDSSALREAGWRPVSTTGEEIARMMAAD